ncbi:MAG: ATP-binding protein [Clostridia bacterium]|nr:ATP-binding protein [Clostridia bacterium]
MYSYQNYQKAKETIENRRQRAIAMADARDNEVRQLSETIKEIDSELTGTGLLLFKTACGGGDIEPIKRRNLELMAKRKAELVRLGLPEDYTEVHYTCKRCSDSGFVDTRMCSCLKELLVMMNIESSGMGKLIEKQSFENFDLEWYRTSEEDYKRMVYNVRCAREYAESFGGGAKNLLLIGNTGTGKTHISTSIAKAIISKGFDVLYDSAQNIVAAFEQDRFHSGYGERESSAEKYMECDLLILDDLGTEFVNQFTVSCLYNLINTRQNRGKSTIISTNLSPEELSGKYEGRIYSRIVGCDYKVLVFKGKDHRIHSR